MRGTRPPVRTDEPAQLPGIGAGGPDAPRGQRRLAILKLGVAAAIAAAGLLTGQALGGLSLLQIALVVFLVTAVLAVGTELPWQFLRDWVPFMAVIGLYTATRNLADGMGMPTHWTPQLEADRWLGGGTVPTVWLQEHLMLPGGQIAWWERATSTVYVTHFVASVVLALVLWFASRRQYWSFVARLVAVLFIGVVVYVLVPAAPPWAAARCTAADVADHPRSPACMADPTPSHPGDVLLPTPDSRADEPVVVRVTTRGFQHGPVPVEANGGLGDLANQENLVAAVPSLHAACSMLIALFLIRRGRRQMRWLWLAYPLAMAFTLVWTGDHYVADIVLGWTLVVVVDLLVTRVLRTSRVAEPSER